MSATPKKSTEAEDVLEFLNSLPEIDKTMKKDDGDILGFLDELEKSDKGKVVQNQAKKEANKEANANPEDKEISKEIKKEIEKEINKAKDDVQETKEIKRPLNDFTDYIKDQSQEEEEQDFVDPITSISNWWSSSGSATVTSLWSNAQQFTQKAQEEAQKLAKDTKIEEQLKKIQNLQLDDETKQKIMNAGDEIDPTKAIGFFTKNLSNVLNSIMSTDEILKISIIHDLENYNIDSLVSKSFKKVMKQVQGGIDIEINKNNPRDHDKRNLNIFQGKSIDGEKLALANMETIINSLKQDQDDEIRSSNLFISILAIQPIQKDNDSTTMVIDTTSSNSFHFLIFLKDITNDISILTKSQSFPMKWSNWLDGSTEATEEKEDEGVDPAEWVKDWIYDGIGLSLGVLAQSYVVKRMGYD
jgi:hypothetical protein